MTRLDLVSLLGNFSARNEDNRDIQHSFRLKGEKKILKIFNVIQLLRNSSTSNKVKFQKIQTSLFFNIFTTYKFFFFFVLKEEMKSRNL